MQYSSKGWKVRFSLIKPLKYECSSQGHTKLQNQQNLMDKIHSTIQTLSASRIAEICKNNKLDMLGKKEKFCVSEPENI